MILDNENENLKVHEWIRKYTEEGKLDIVTGYFTIGALAYLSNTVNDKIDKFRLVLGDIVSFDIEENRPLDLLNENIAIEAALKLSSLSQKAVHFLKQDKVLAKTLVRVLSPLPKKAIFDRLHRFMPFHVYILFSTKIQKTYVGLTSNLDARIKSHNVSKKGRTTCHHTIAPSTHYSCSLGRSLRSR